VACLRAHPGAQVVYHAGHNVREVVDVPAAGVGEATQVHAEEEAVYQPQHGNAGDLSRRITRVPSKHYFRSKANRVQLDRMFAFIPFSYSQPARQQQAIIVEACHR
jgi:hypothetical protein